MHKNRIYQLKKIPVIILGIFILYISFVESKIQTPMEYFGLIFLIIAIIYFSGFTYSFDNGNITRYWYFLKRNYKFSEIQLIVNFNSKMKAINIYLKFNTKYATKILEYTRKYINYSDGIKICYWFQKKKIVTMIKLINEMNPECVFTIKGEAVPIELFLDSL
ncbi:hypothetical protein [Treponema zioleckii]|uniref:hypothetical protein n=1 Tax=Treponema zioleckii TaxID=331680 RepID=UPI00168B3A5A|nr:hypothetical protein [Treponema zioleckii]